GVAVLLLHVGELGLDVGRLARADLGRPLRRRKRRSGRGRLRRSLATTQASRRQGQDRRPAPPVESEHGPLLYRPVPRPGPSPVPILPGPTAPVPMAPPPAGIGTAAPCTRRFSIIRKCKRSASTPERPTAIDGPMTTRSGGTGRLFTLRMLMT